MAIFDFLKEIPLSALLREKLKDVESELTKLREENAKLVAAAKLKDNEIEALASQLKTRADADLDDEEAAVLKALAQHSPNEEAQEGVIAQMAGVGIQVASYHLENLRTKKYAEAHQYASMPSAGIYAETQWTLAHLGRGQSTELNVNELELSS